MVRRVFETHRGPLPLVARLALLLVRLRYAGRTLRLFTAWHVFVPDSAGKDEVEAPE
jgi:hypothetical protein